MFTDTLSIIVSQPTQRAIPKNPKFESVRPVVDTGASVSKVEQISKAHARVVFAFSLFLISIFTCHLSLVRHGTSLAITATVKPLLYL